LPQKQPERAQEQAGTMQQDIVQQARQQERIEQLTGTEHDEKSFSPLLVKKFLNESGRKYANGESLNSILKEYGLAPGGRNNQNLKVLLDGMAAED
jgi:hypothetical protein